MSPCLLQAVVIAAGLSGLKSAADPGAPKLPLNLLDAIRAYDADEALKAAMGDEFSTAYEAEDAGMERLREPFLALRA